MHICHVCPYTLSLPGGVRTHILDLCSTLQDQGHRVTVIGAHDERGPYTDLPVFRVATGGKRLPLWGTVIDVLRLTRDDRSRLLHFFRTEQVDVLHFHTPWTPFMSMQLLGLAGQLPPEIRPRLVATFHDSPPDSLWGRVLGRYVMPLAARRLMPRFDHVISVSEPQKQYLVRFSDYPVDVIPNGFRYREGVASEGDAVEGKKETTAAEDDAISGASKAVTQTMGSAAGDTLESEQIVQQVHNPRELPHTLLFLSRLEPRKGVIHALRVYRRLLNLHPRLELLIAGEGSAETAARSYVKQYDLNGVHFLGYVEENEKQALYRRADVYLAPALYGESFGIVLLEAMAAGTPVAGYGNAGYRTVADGYAPENFPDPGDVTALAARVDVLLSDPVYRNTIIQRGLRHVSRFDWRTVAESVLAVYQR